MEESSSNIVRDNIIILLDVAIQNLEVFIKASQQKVPTIYSVNVEGNHLTPGRSHTFPFLHAFLPKYQKENRFKHQAIKQIIFSSIEVLQKHSRLLLKLKRGNTEEQQWAKHGLDVINAYNALLIKSRKPPESFTEKLKNSFYSYTGISLITAELKKNWIEIPSEIFMRFDSFGDHEGKTMEKIATELRKGKLVEFSKTERDIFCMRAITLAEKSKLPPELSVDLNTLMRSTPITALETEGDSTSSVISMVQMLTPFPGEVITVRGQFKRDETSHVPSVPDPKSFRVSTIVTQTGFPHPSQYTGWALSNVVIPQNPLRMDLLSHFQTIVKIKKQVATDLLPGERLNLKAKELLILKKEVFDENSEGFIRQHEELSNAILKAAPYKSLKDKSSQEKIDTFYALLKTHPTPFDFISQTHQMINKFFIDYPHEKLVQEWHSHQNPDLHEGDPKDRFRATSELLQRALELACEEVTIQLKQPQTKIEEATLNFIFLQGRILGQAASSLFLQHFSEKIGFAPPLLKHFELMIQTCSIRQVLAFQRELDFVLTPNKQEMKSQHKQNLERLIKEDIAIFQEDPDFEEPTLKIAHELERYYNSRYNYQLNLPKKK
ncbi:MAG: hypothetical protein K940chlam3_00577 [Chlamydiae bacterium]|nr:hypothetical protein [Chlamydiota bacterium]